MKLKDYGVRGQKWFSQIFPEITLESFEFFHYGFLFDDKEAKILFTHRQRIVIFSDFGHHYTPC